MGETRGAGVLNDCKRVGWWRRTLCAAVGAQARLLVEPRGDVERVVR